MASEHGDTLPNGDHSIPTNLQQIVSSEEYKILQANYNRLQQQYDHVVAATRTVTPQAPLIRFHDYRIPSSESDESNDNDDDHHTGENHDDHDETSSVELDENFEPVKTYSQDSSTLSSLNSIPSGAFDSFDYPQSAQSNFSLANGTRIAMTSLDTTHISPEIHARIVRENMRLKKTLKRDRIQWNKDNARGIETITKLQIDVAKLKHERQKLMPREIHEKEIKELKDKNEENRALLVQQMQVFKDDFEKERDGRNNSLQKLKDVMTQIKRYKDQIPALKQEKDRYKQEALQLRRTLQFMQHTYGASRPGSFSPATNASQRAPLPMATGCGQTLESPPHLPMVVVADSAESDCKKSTDVRKSPTKLEEESTRQDPMGSESFKKFGEDKPDALKRMSDEES